MKICYLANAASIHTQRWANYFVEHGWKVDLITWRSPGGSTTISPNVDVHRIHFPPHYIARYGALLEIALLMRKIRPDIIHAHYLGHFGILAGLYGRLTGFRPIVLTAWGSDVLIDAKLWKRWLIKQTAGRADCVTCQGNNVARELVCLGIDSQKIAVIRFGVNVNEFYPLQEDRKLKEQLGTANARTVISIRSLEPVYDVESLVMAIPLVLEDVPGTQFLIGGRGRLEAKLQSLSECLGVKDSVKWLGWIPHHELPKYFALSDVYVSTSLSDSGLSVSNAEAMACGLPVVITDIADHRQWVQEGINGFVVPVSDPKALASRIVSVLKDEELRDKARRINRQLIEQRFNCDTEMEKMRRKYEELLETVRADRLVL